MLIDSNGEKLGIFTIDEALKKASSENLDLVQVSPKNAKPTVCKILNHGKYIFDKKKNSQISKSKTKKTTTKEIKFRPSTDVGDYEIKLKKIKSFIIGGDRTKITVRFRGREILNSQQGLELLKKIKIDLEEIAKVESEPSLEGRQLIMLLSPQKK